MDSYDRPRKQIPQEGQAARRRKTAVSRGVPSGKLKGKPLTADDRIGPQKPPLAAARRTASDVEQSPSRRKDLPLPIERSDRDNRHEGRSLRLTLRVEGERITVVNAIEVDAPPQPLEPVRGTNFLEVRAGDRVLALEVLVDPGVAIGIPDRRDTTEFRGHREIEMPFYEVAVRVPLEAMESTEGRLKDGESIRAPIEATIYRASERLELDPVRFERDRETRRQLARVAATGQLGVDEIRRASRSENRKPEPRQQF
jgi:hypothetical protein